MKYDTIQILKLITNAINDPTIITDKLGITELFEFPTNLHSKNSIYAEEENSNKAYTENSNNEYNKIIPVEDNGFFNDNNDATKNNSYYNKQQDTSSDPQGVIDSITQEMTPVRLQQAIVLSEIVGKPRSKTRKRRKF